jgi:hypothetical protein
MKCKIPKKFNVSFEGKGGKAQSKSAVTTGYCTNGVPCLNTKELNRKNVIENSGGKLSKLLLNGVRNTIKMKQKKPKQQANINVLSNNGENLGTKTLKTIGISISNLFKPSKRIGRKDYDYTTIDPKNHITDIYLPPEFKLVEKKSPFVTPTTCRPDVTNASERISRTCHPKIVTRKTCLNLGVYSGMLTRCSPPPTTFTPICMSPRKTQPSMGVNAKHLKNMRSVNGQFGGAQSVTSLVSQCYDSNSGARPTDETYILNSTTNNSLLAEQTIAQFKPNVKEDSRGIYENVSFIQKSTTVNKTFVVDVSNGKISQNDLDISGYNFEKYLVRGDSPDETNSSPETTFVSMTNPTPVAKFSIQSRYKKLKRRSNESCSKLINLDSLVDYESNLENYISDV